MATTGIRKIRNMVDKVGDGDLAGAQDAFDAAVIARREAQIANYKTSIAPGHRLLQSQQIFSHYT